HRVRATKARCSTRGPCAAVRRDRQAAQRASTGMSMPFRQGRMPCRKAWTRLTDLPGRIPGKRQAGWPLFGPRFPGHTEKGGSGAEGARKLRPCEPCGERAFKSETELDPDRRPARRKRRTGCRLHSMVTDVTLASEMPVANSVCTATATPYFTR